MRTAQKPSDEFDRFPAEFGLPRRFVPQADCEATALADGAGALLLGWTSSWRCAGLRTVMVLLLVLGSSSPPGNYCAHHIGRSHRAGFPPASASVSATSPGAAVAMVPGGRHGRSCQDGRSRGLFHCDKCTDVEPNVGSVLGKDGSVRRWVSRAKADRSFLIPRLWREIGSAGNAGADMPSVSLAWLGNVTLEPLAQLTVGCLVASARRSTRRHADARARLDGRARSRFSPDLAILLLDHRTLAAHVGRPQRGVSLIQSCIASFRSTVVESCWSQPASADQVGSSQSRTAR